MTAPPAICFRPEQFTDQKNQLPLVKSMMTLLKNLKKRVTPLLKNWKKTLIGCGVSGSASKRYVIACSMTPAGVCFAMYLGNSF